LPPLARKFKPKFGRESVQRRERERERERERADWRDSAERD
jgi:hypothetical protein